MYNLVGKMLSIMRVERNVVVAKLPYKCIRNDKMFETISKFQLKKKIKKIFNNILVRETK